MNNNADPQIKSKRAEDPDSYHRITVTSIISKVVEKEILARTKEIGQNTKSGLQIGFTQGVTPLTAAMHIMEVIHNAKTQGQDIKIIFMDASKAFVASMNMMLMSRP